MAFLDRFHKLVARKLLIKGAEATPLDVQDRTGSSLFSVNSSGNVTAAGTQTFTGNTTLSGTLGVTGATTLSSTLAVTGASTLSGAVNYKKQVTDTGGAFATPIVLTAAQSGRVILLDDAAGLDFTLPAIAAADIGMHFSFRLVTEVTSNSYRITAATGDLLDGHVMIVDKDVAEGSTEALMQIFRPDGSDDLIITIAGADDTTGSLVGGWLELEALTATKWFVRGSLVGDGALATIFS